MRQINFGKSDWVRSRPNPSEFSDNIVVIPETGELPPLPPHSCILKGGRPSGPDNNFMITAAVEDTPEGIDILIYWIEERGEWVAIIRRKWIEMVFTDENYSGPFRLGEACCQKILQAYNIPNGKIRIDEVAKTSPKKLVELAK